MRFKTRRKEKKKEKKRPYPKTKETCPLASSSVVVVSHFEGPLTPPRHADGDRRGGSHDHGTATADDRDRDAAGGDGFRFLVLQRSSPVDSAMNILY